MIVSIYSSWDFKLRNPSRLEKFHFRMCVFSKLIYHEWLAKFDKEAKYVG